MSDKRQRTVLEIGVDAQQLKSLDDTLHQTFDSQMLEAFERTLDRTVRTMESLVRVTEKMESSLSRVGGGLGSVGGGGGGHGGGGGGHGGGGGGGGAYHAGGGGGPQAGGPSFFNRMGATAMGTYLGNVGQGAAGGGFTASAFGGIPLVGPLLSAAIQSAQGYYGAYAGQQQALAGSVGATGYARPPSLARYGLDRGQSAGFMQQMAGVSGLTGQDLAMFTPSAARAQHLGGVRGGGLDLVRAENAGGGGGYSGGAAFEGHMARALGTGAGNQADFRLPAAGIGAGLMSGVREGRLSQFTSGIAGQVESNRMMGGGASTVGQLQLSAGLANLGNPNEGNNGFRGEAGMAAAGNVLRSGQSFSPSNMSPIDTMKLMAAGLGEPGVTMHDALRRIHNNPGEVMESMRQRLIEMGGGPGTDASVELMRTYMPTAWGIGGTMNQADSLAGGGPMDMAGLGEMAAEGGEFLSNRNRDVGGAFGVARTEAHHRNREAGIGRDVARSVQTIRRIDQRAAGSITAPVVNMIGGAMNTIESADSIPAGIGQVASDIASSIGAAVSSTLSNWLGGGGGGGGGGAGAPPGTPASNNAGNGVVITPQPGGGSVVHQYSSNEAVHEGQTLEEGLMTLARIAGRREAAHESDYVTGMG